MNLGKRSIESVSWNIVANINRIAILLIRSILLARWLPVETFGVYGFAGVLVSLSLALATFGLLGAFIHRSKETENEQEAIANYFSLRILFLSIWAILLGTGTWLFAEGLVQQTIFILMILLGGLHVIDAPKAILIRRVAHKRLAALQVLNALLTTIASLALAKMGATIGALLATDLVTLVTTFFVLYVWPPAIWRPRFAWDPDVIRYYLHFGKRNLLATLLIQVLDKIDDLWTGYYLGAASLGLYGRAYAFATYPRQLLATPLNQVAGGIYAELKTNRSYLSKAFFRTNALLIRSSFLLGGLMALVAPEFVQIFLGEKWIPMTDTFRLMLIFTLLDPIRRTISNLFISVGKPEIVSYIRMTQLVVLVGGLYSLGLSFDIVGVALAVNIMLATGILLLFQKARTYVDFSLTRLFTTPSIGLALGAGLALLITNTSIVPDSEWWIAGVKTAVFLPTYALILLLLERNQLQEMWVFIWQKLRPRPTHT
ncbi:MAG: hypothetical protein CSB13_01495 [Chloroflexi bacterium]|nr:MAG: hypothetical protein CSB13_01495 [Chloroflexota bacterium]